MARPKAFDRETALKQAMHIFWAKGYDGTSVSDLTDGMGLSRSSLYETFGDKQDLFLETLSHYIQVIDNNRARILFKTDSAKQNLQFFFRGVVNFNLKDDQPGGCFYTNTATALGSLDKRIQVLIKQGAEKQEADFYRCLHQGKKNGEIRSDKDIRALARFLQGLVRGISVVGRIEKDRKVLEDIVGIGLKAVE